MQVTIDVSTWTQTEKNYLQAAAYALIWQQLGIDASDISVKDGVISTSLVTQDVSAILNVTTLKTFIAAELEKARLAGEVAKIEAGVREAELTTSQFKEITLAQVDTMINAISNLADAKVFLKKAVRYLIARS